MNKITKIIELDPRKLDPERLPIERCLFTCNENEEIEGKPLRKLTGLNCDIDNRLMFVSEDGINYRRCAEVIQRYPRDVPERVTPLPDDKPFLAFLGKGVVKGTAGKRIPALWKSWNAAWNNQGGAGCYGDDGISIFYALDISDPWTKEHYPEFVEAMEYEPIYDKQELHELQEYIDANNFITDANQQLEHCKIGHKLGGRSYDLEWNLVEPNGEPPISFRESADPLVWAEAFVEHKNRNNWVFEEIDEGLMLAWFANAMEAARGLSEEHQKADQSADGKYDSKIERIKEWLKNNYNVDFGLLPTRSWSREDLLAIPQLLFLRLLNKTIPEVEIQKSEVSDMPDSTEPLDVEDYLNLGEFDGELRVAARLMFIAGKGRGKWEAANWKYEMAYEAYKSDRAYDCIDFPKFSEIFNIARETKDSE